MRKIKFDEKTINDIRTFINEGHTLGETCNRFTLKGDTLRRVMYENNIAPYHPSRGVHRVVSEQDETQVCNMFRNTHIRMEEICKETKLLNFVVQDIIKRNFTQEEIDARKHQIYRDSKLGDKNPMNGKFGDKHHNYKGIIDDGNGYLMILKPEWYTGRKEHTYVYYHHIVFCEASGLSEIPKGFVIHHIDFNPKNNDISNLALMSISAHAKLHNQIRNLSKVQRLSHSGVGETPSAKH